jgi:sugar/nucleoside kinase (ribokinase family)
MKIGVIGTFINDHIILASGEERNSFGGIYYTVSMLAHLLSADDEIYPICYLGRDSYEPIVTRLSAFKNIRLKGIHKIDHPNTAVTLIYRNTEQRNEILTHRLPPLEQELLADVEGMDVWLLNFITGFEMTLETCQHFCRQQKAPIYMDFHSLSLAIDDRGRRHLCHRPDWKAWIDGVDMLQMNEAEAASLRHQTQLTLAELRQLGEEIVAKQVPILHITRGSKGSLLVYRHAERVVSQEIPAAAVDPVIDVTGCGDAFAAGFLVHYWNSRHLIAATEFANRVAGINCTLRGTEELWQLKGLITQAK